MNPLSDMLAWCRRLFPVSKELRRLEELAAFQTAILNAAGNSVITTDTHGTITLFNPAAQQMLGYAAADIVGKCSPALFHLPEEVAARARVLTLELGRDVEPGFEAFVAKARVQGSDAGDWTYVAKDGKHIPVHLTVTALYSQDGTLFGYLGIAADLSSRRRTELAVLQAKEAAEEATKAKSDFLANMSHEIRTPINGVTGMTELLLQTYLDQEQRGIVRHIRSCTDSLLCVINDILDFSRIEAGKMDLECIPFELQQVLDDVSAALILKAQEKRIEFICAAMSDVPDRLTGDPIRLRQILLNLASNAIKFTESGEVSVVVSLVARASEHLRLQFSVRDSGIGVPLEIHDSLFESFHQADASTSRKYGGSGLGLAISKRLTNAMGGDIQLHSIPGYGSRFWFELDFAIPSRSHRTCQVPPGLRVLLIDDNATLRELLLRQLQEWRCEIRHTSSAAEAIEQMELAWNAADPLEIVIVNESLEKDGELGRAIRSRVQSPAPTLVLLSSLEIRQPGNMDLSGIYDHFLTKPVRMEELEQILAGSIAFERTVDHRDFHPHARPPDQACKILVAEDNPVNQRVIAGLLHKLGHDVTLACDGMQALDALRADDFHLLFLDLQMPVLDGYETIVALRECGSKIPVVALTANASEEDRNRCLELGMDDHMGKPFTLRSLTGMIERWARTS